MLTNGEGIEYYAEGDWLWKSIGRSVWMVTDGEK